MQITSHEGSGANLAIIPARGGSKRIPRKNVKDFLGKPIIAYSIEAALESHFFYEVMVSTDDEEIAEVAIKYGAKVPFLRSDKNADNFATLNDVMQEVLDKYKSLDLAFEFACCILPTAPFITKERLKEGYDLMVNKRFDSVRPIVKFSYPIQRAFKLDSEAKVNFFYPEYSTTRSQDLEPSYHDAGQFYWFRTSKFLKGSNKGGLVIKETEAHDIDSPEDWQIAELKYRNLVLPG